MNTQTTDVALDDLMDALAHFERRRLLLAILERNPQDDVPPPVDGKQSTTDIQRLTSMYHTHLPKLESYGFVEWDREIHEVTKGPNFDEIRPLLELLDDHRDELPPNWLEPQ